MDLNTSKCGVMSFTRSRQPVTTEYKLLDSPLKQLCHQKDLGLLSQSQEITSKASSMLGFIRRTASDTHNIHVRKVLYLSSVRSKLGYASQVWAPQTVTDILSIERAQRRATKFILSLPYRTVTTYRERLRGLLVFSQSAIGTTRTILEHLSQCASNAIQLGPHNWRLSLWLVPARIVCKFCKVLVLFYVCYVWRIL